MFASMLSLLSIVLTIFEYISAKVLLNTESVLIIKMFIESSEISSLSANEFKKFHNCRKPISNEISKVIGIDYRLIELLKPKQTKQGCDLIFHIRIGNGKSGLQDEETSNALQLIKAEISNGSLGKCFYKQWTNVMPDTMNSSLVGKKWRLPKITNIETKYLGPEQNEGDHDEHAAVIGLAALGGNTTKLSTVRSTSSFNGGTSTINAATPSETPRDVNFNFNLEQNQPKASKDELMMMEDIGNGSGNETNVGQKRGERGMSLELDNNEVQDLFENERANAHLVEVEAVGIHAQNALNQAAPQAAIKGIVGEALGPAGFETGFDGMEPILTQKSRSEDNDSDDNSKTVSKSRVTSFGPAPGSKALRRGGSRSRSYNKTKKKLAKKQNDDNIQYVIKRSETDKDGVVNINCNDDDNDVIKNMPMVKNGGVGTISTELYNESEGK